MAGYPYPRGDIAQNVYNDKYEAIKTIRQDQYTEVIDLYMTRVLGTTNPTNSMNINDKTITVNSTTGAALFDAINIIEGSRIFQAIIQNITGNVITFNAPCDYEFTTNALVEFGEWNMNFDGSVTPLYYALRMNGLDSDVKFDITRIIIGMTDDSAMDDGKFGGITSLTNGVVLRYKNNEYKNIFVVSDNGGFRERSFDVQYLDATLGPAGLYGFGCRRTFSGEDKNGVVIRLQASENDELQFIIQDNLTALNKLAVVVQGHVVD